MHPNHKETLAQVAARVAARLTAPVLLGAAFAGSAGAAEPAPAPEPSREQLQQQLQQLQERVRSLESTAQAPAPAAGLSTSADIDHVLKDAERRSSLAPVFGAGGGFTAGYDKGFFIKSDDGNFLLKPGIQVQFRNVTNFEQDAKHKGEDDSFQNGFEVRRARFRFDGNAFSPKFTYSFVWDTNRSNGNVTLLDAWGQYAFAKEWAFKAGQFKESVFHERDVSGYQQLAVDRSLNDAILGGNLTDRVQGVALVYGGTKENPVRAELAYHDGANSKNTDFRDGATNWGAGLRGEYKLFGDWAAYKDLTAKGGKENLLVFGAGADYTDRDASNVLLSTADVQFEAADKLVLYGAVHGNFTDPHENATSGTKRFDWGALAQAGYLVTKQWEVFGRYDVVKLDDDAVSAGAEDTFHEITGGVNYYFGKDGQYLNRAKFSLDVTYLPNGAPSDQTQAGILAADGDEIVVRAQFQLLLQAADVRRVMADVAIEAGEVTDSGNGEGDAAGATWVDAPAAGGVMAGVLASFSEHGFDLGYRRAVSDAIALLLLTAAEHRRESGADPQLRAAVSAFVDRLDRQLQRLSPAVADEMYGGLGI